MSQLSLRETNLRKIVESINSLYRGKNNHSGTVTQESGDTTVTISNLFISADSAIIITPTNAIAASLTYYVTPSNGEFTITSTIAPSADATWAYAFYGG